MKTADIKTDGTEYAVTFSPTVSPTYGPFLGDAYGIVRGRVIETGLPRTHRGARSHGSKPLTDGLRIVSINDGVQHTLRPAQVLGTWAEHEDATQRRVAAKRVSDQREREATAQRVSAWKSIEGLIGKEATDRLAYRGRPSSFSMTPESLAALLQKAADPERAQG